jgi:outer membrane lipoprotein-sorting protein
MNIRILFFGILLYQTNLFGQMSTTDLLQKSFEYYNNLSYQSFLVTRKFKAVINTDTTINHYIGFFQKREGKKMMKLVFEDGDYTMYDNENSFFIYPSRAQVFYNNSKENKSNTRLKEFPYFLSKLFFEELPKKIRSSKTVTDVKANTYNGFDIYFIRKESNWLLSLDSIFRIIKYREIINSSLGVQVKEYSFEETDSLITTNLFDELESIKAVFQHISSYERKDDGNKDLIGRK